MLNFFRTHRLAILKALALLVTLATIHLPSIRQHAHNGKTLYNADAFMHLPPYLRDVSDPVRDYPERYIRACHPLGFRLLYSLAVAGDAVPTLSRLLPYGLTALFVLLVTLAALPLGGWRMATVVALLALSADIFLNRAGGGLPRAFGFSLLAACLAATVHRRPLALAVSTVLAALFYPTAAVVGGIILAAGILIPPLRIFPSIAARPLKHRLTVIFLTGSLCLASLLPTLMATRPYGDSVGPRDFDDYPEAGPGGRCESVDRFDYKASLAEALRNYLPDTIKNGGQPFIPALRSMRKPPLHDNPVFIPLLLLSAMGLIRLTTSSAAGRGLALFSASCLLAYLASRALSPLLFLPERFVSYPIPLLGLFLLPAGCAALGHWFAPRPLRPRAAAVTGAVGGLVLLAVFGGRLNPEAGYTTKFRHLPVYDYLARLPTAFVAGAPEWLSPIPYISSKPVLVSQETHLPYHPRFLDEMRRRMAAQIHALYSPDAADLLALHRRYHVTHLVIPHAIMHQDYGGYFMPFSAWHLAASSEFDSHPPAVRALAATHAVYADEQVVVLDLTTLSAAAAAPAPSAASTAAREPAATAGKTQHPETPEHP